MVLSIYVFLTCIFSYNISAQLKYDTIIDMGIYKSYFNLTLKQPIAVSYTLFNGGGIADRKNDKFKSTSITLTDKDYHYCGYDRGHLVPAEDFAYNDSLQAITFSYYNVVPQTANLNRGKWKSLECRVRQLSQRDTLRIICINEYSNSWIPVACYKFVYCKGKLLIEEGYSNSINPIQIKASQKILQLVISILKK